MAKEDRIISIVGCGPGSPDYLTPVAREVAGATDVLVGTQRLLDLFPGVGGERITVGAALDEVLDRVEKCSCSKRVAVLVTGDPGLHSLARLVIERFGRDRCRVVPGISSVQTAFARLGVDWNDAVIISAHKQDPEPDPSWARADKIAVLGGRANSLGWIAEKLLPMLEDRQVFVCEDLTLEDESVRKVEADKLSNLVCSSHTVVLILKRNLLK